MKRAFAVLLLTAGPSAAQMLRAGGAPASAPFAGAPRGLSAFEGALRPLELAPALRLQPLSAAAVTLVPNGVPAAQEPAKRPVPVYDRAKISKKTAASVAERRASLVATMTDPNVIRFPLPKTKAFAAAVTARLLSGSGLSAHAGPDGLVVRVNDASWGGPGASMSAGVLTVEPEMIAVMSSEDEVAAVIAHEIVHYLRAHDEQLVGLRGWSLPSFGSGGGDMLDGGPRMSSRELAARLKHEFEADALSLRLLVNAGYDPEAAVSALLVVENERNTEPRYEFGRGRRDPTHPELERRIEELRRVMKEERMLPSRRSAGALPEVYDELKNRKRDYKGAPSHGDETTAAELYRHYSRPKSFAP